MGYEDDLDRVLTGLGAADRELLEWLQSRQELRAAARLFLATMADAAEKAGKEILLPLIRAAAEGLVRGQLDSLSDRLK